VAVVDKRHNVDVQHFELADVAVADVVVDGDGNTHRTSGVVEGEEVAHPIVGRVHNLEEWREKVEVGRVEEPLAVAVVEVLEVVEERIAAAGEVDVGVEELG